MMVLSASKVEGVSLDEPSVKVHVTERTIRLPPCPCCEACETLFSAKMLSQSGKTSGCHKFPNIGHKLR